MMLLVLVLLVAAIGTFIAVPLFEFVVASLLLTPLLKFLLAMILGLFGHEIVGGNREQIFYVFCFLTLLVSSYGFFGPRTEKLSLREWSPLIAFTVVFTVAHRLCLSWADFYDIGERLRDYALLASAIDSPVVPREPWMEGANLNYYVFWYRFGAMVSSVVRMPVWDTYHTMIAFSMALYGAVIFQIIRVVCGGGFVLSSLGALLIPLGPNVAGMFSLKRTKEGFEHDSFWWGPSRVVEGAITEFPAWSFVLGDAHPHYLNLATVPFLLLLLYRVIVSKADALRRCVQAFMLVIAGALFLKGSNAWEVPMWVGTAVMIGLTALIIMKPDYLSRRAQGLEASKRDVDRSGEPSTMFDTIKLVCSIGMFIAVLGLVFFMRHKAPVWQSVALIIANIVFLFVFFPARVSLPKVRLSGTLTTRDVGWSVFWILLCVVLWLSSAHIKAEGGPLTFVRSPIPVTTTAELFVHWGTQLVLITIASFLLCRWNLASFMMGVFLAVTLLFDKGALFLYTLIGIQLIRLLRPRQDRAGWQEVFSEALLISSLGLVLLPEVVFLNDSYGPEIERMNTIFKIYTTSWALLGLSAISMLQRVDAFRVKEWGPAAPKALGAAAFVMVAIGTGRFYSQTLHHRVITEPSQYGSEGLGTVERRHPGSAAIIQALRELPHGRVLEAQGPAYRLTSFVSTLAGQPSYLGWSNHVNLLTRLSAEIGRREKVTEQFYTETDCAKRLELAKRESISYIVVGSLEKEKYPQLPQIDFTCFNRKAYDKGYSLYSN